MVIPSMKRGHMKQLWATCLSNQPELLQKKSPRQLLAKSFWVNAPYKGCCCFTMDLPIHLKFNFHLQIAVGILEILQQTKGLWMRRGIFNGMAMQSKVLFFWEKRKTDAIWKFHACPGHWNKYKWQKWMARQDRVTNSTEYRGIAISLRLQQTNTKRF